MGKLFALLSIFYLLFTFTLQAQVYELDRPYRNHLEMKRLKGKVKEVREYRFKSTNQEKDSSDAKGALEMYFITTYNTKGNKISHRQFRADNTLARLEEYEYDAKGRLLSVKGRYPDSEGSGSVISYTYDSKGRLIAESDKMQASGNKIFEKNYYYDNKNRLIRTESLFPTNKDRHTTLISYKDNTELVETTYKRSIETTKIARYYDARSKLLLKEIHIYPKAPSSSTAYDYDDNFGNNTALRRFKGDEKKLYIQELFRYQYDENDNWISRLGIYKSYYHSQSIATRKLSYY